MWRQARPGKQPLAKACQAGIMDTAMQWLGKNVFTFFLARQAGVCQSPSLRSLQAGAHVPCFRFIDGYAVAR